MDPEPKDKEQGERSGESIAEDEPTPKRTKEDEEPIEDLFTDCSVPTQDKHKSQPATPDTVTTSKLEWPTTFWELWKLDDKSESKIGPMRNWQPKATCRTLCICYPAQALQVYGLSIYSKEDNKISGQVDISGVFAIRDYYDKRRIKIFNRESADPASMEFTNGDGTVRMTTPRRGILYGDLVFDYELNIKYRTEEGSMAEEKIEGKSHYEGNKCPYSSRPKIIHASIPTNSGCRIKEIYLKFVRFAMGIEAQIELHPPEGLRFCLTARLSNIPVEVLLFEGEYKKPCETRDDEPLKFVLVVPFLDILELEFTSPSHTSIQPKIYAFKSFYHGRSSKEIYFESSKIEMTIKWSRM